jgi:hypothetical protein
MTIIIIVYRINGQNLLFFWEFIIFIFFSFLVGLMKISVKAPLGTSS